MERLRTLREPAAWVLLAAIALQIVLAVVAVGYFTTVAGPSGAGYIAAQQLSRTLVIAATVVVASCVLWGRPTPHARLVSLIGAVLFVLHAVLALVLAIVGMFEAGSSFAMVTVLLELLVPAMAAAVLLVARSTLRPWPRPGFASAPTGGPAAQPGHPVPGPPPSSRRPAPPAQPGWPEPPSGQEPTAPPPGPEQPAHQPVRRGPAQRDHRRAQPIPPAVAGHHRAAGGEQFRGPDRDVRSQTDQFGNQHPNSSGQFQGFPEQPTPTAGDPAVGPADPTATIEPRTEPRTEPWQPVNQAGPQRLEPSPYRSPVGPHTRPEETDRPENR